MTQNTLIQLNVDCRSPNSLLKFNINFLSNISPFCVVSRHTMLIILRLKVEKIIKFVPRLLLELFFSTLLRIVPKLLLLVGICPFGLLWLLTRFSSFIFSFQIKPISFIIWKDCFTCVLVMIVLKWLVNEAILCIVSIAFLLVTQSFICFCDFFKLSSSFWFWVEIRMPFFSHSKVSFLDFRFWGWWFKSKLLIKILETN